MCGFGLFTKVVVLDQSTGYVGVLLCTNFNAAALAWEAPDALLAKGCFGRICIAGVLGGGVLVGCNPDRVVDLNENLNIRYDLWKFPIRL